MAFHLSNKRADRVSTVLLQEALNQQGYGAGHTDGRYGLSTTRAVVAFQTEHGLTPTGMVDGLEEFDAIIAGKAPKKAPAKKAPAEKKAPAKKPAEAKKPPAKKAPAKKPAAKKPAAKKG